MTYRKDIHYTVTCTTCGGYIQQFYLKEGDIIPSINETCERCQTKALAETGYAYCPTCQRTLPVNTMYYAERTYNPHQDWYDDPICYSCYTKDILAPIINDKKFIEYYSPRGVVALLTKVLNIEK
jgi:predicted amidophosphoribosyltransferase